MYPSSAWYHYCHKMMRCFISINIPDRNQHLFRNVPWLLLFVSFHLKIKWYIIFIKYWQIYSILKMIVLNVTPLFQTVNMFSEMWALIASFVKSHSLLHNKKLINDIKIMSLKRIISFRCPYNIDILWYFKT